MQSSRPQHPNEQAFRLILILGLTCFALVLTIVYLLIKPASVPSSQTQLTPDIREEAIRRLAEAGSGIYDSHSDADVGRVLQPNLQQRQADGIELSTNAFGLRERDYALPKPEGTLRLVLLGDSFVFGYGVRADERLGAYLENQLRERAEGFTGNIECLHIGVTSWDIPAASTYLRRQLSDLRPDLVLHLSLPNDIEGTVGARGFGAWSSFYPRFRHRADSVIRMGFPVRELGFQYPGYLRYGLDHESRSRYADAVDHIRALTTTLSALDIPYRLLMHYRHLLPIGRKYLGQHLPDDQVVYLSKAFGTDRQYWNSNEDLHWNPQGHEKIAKMLYGLITRDQLLPALNLESWDEADDVFSEIAVQGRKDAMVEIDIPKILDEFGMTMPGSIIDFDDLTSESAAQIHGGVDLEQRVSPYAAFVLQNLGKTLKISGETFNRPELIGSTVSVFIEDTRVGEIQLEPGKDIDLSYSVPESFSQLPYLGIRFQSENYVYAGQDLQHCVVFRLRRIEIS